MQYELKYHFFISYSNTDRIKADKLFILLDEYFSVFYAPISIKLGDDWTDSLETAQQESFTTLILYSSNTEKSFYQKVEIIQAIKNYRNSNRKVISIPLEHNAKIPFGLNILQGVSMEFIGNERKIIEVLIDHIKYNEHYLSKLSMKKEWLADESTEILKPEICSEFRNDIKLRIEKYINGFLRKLPKTGKLCIVYMDIDGFGNLNRIFGSDFGDKMLAIINGLIKKYFGGFYTRLTADEYLFIITQEWNNDYLRLFEKISFEIINYDWSILANNFYFDLSFGYSNLRYFGKSLSLDTHEVKQAIQQAVLGMKKSKGSKIKINKGPIFVKANRSYRIWDSVS